MCYGVTRELEVEVDEGQIFGALGWRRKKPLKIQRLLGQIITFHLVCFAWVFFRADSMETALSVITQISDHFTPEVFLQFVVGYKNVLLLLLLGYLLHFTSKKQELRFRSWLTDLPFIGNGHHTQLIFVFLFCFVLF